MSIQTTLVVVVVVVAAEIVAAAVVVVVVVVGVVLIILCGVFTIIYRKHTVFLGCTLLQLFCNYNLWYT